MRTVSIIAALFLFSGAALAQSPYAGMQSRPIKALSNQQLADLKSGRGMGLALAAELNGYPGPSHVLELAHKFALTTDQRTKVQALFASMKAEALAVGGKLISQESELQLFASHTITSDSLQRVTTEIAMTQGELRETHLKYHLFTLALLNQDQVRRY